MERERKERGDEVLRQSLRNSQRLAALKERMPRGAPTPAANGALEEQQQQRPQLPDLGSVMQALRRLETSGVLGEAAAEAVGAVVRGSEFQASVTLSQKVSA